jgi:hypothetical protein
MHRKDKNEKFINRAEIEIPRERKGKIKETSLKKGGKKENKTKTRRMKG